MKTFRSLMMASIAVVFLLSGCNGHRIGFTFKPWGYLIHADKQYLGKGPVAVSGAPECICEGGVPTVSRYQEPPVIKVVPKN